MLGYLNIGISEYFKKQHLVRRFYDVRFEPEDAALQNCVAEVSH